MTTQLTSRTVSRALSKALMFIGLVVVVVALLAFGSLVSAMDAKGAYSAHSSPGGTSSHSEDGMLSTPSGASGRGADTAPAKQDQVPEEPIPMV